MNWSPPEFSSSGFNEKAVRPVECLKEGWSQIKNRYWLFLGITLLGVILASMAPLGLLMGAMFCGIYICLLTHFRGGDVKFEMLFRGFDFFVPGLVAALLQMIPTVIIIVGFYILFFVGFFLSITAGVASAGQGNNPPPEAPALAFFLILAVIVIALIILMLLIHILFMFSYPLIIDRKLSGLDAVKLSMRAAWRNFGGLFLLMLLNTLLSFCGLCLCYIGAFFVMPVTFASYGIAYEQIFTTRYNKPSWNT